jgi:hypothetical protein
MNNQGKRPDQLKTSEKIVFCCFVGMLIILLIQSIIND